MMLGLYLFIFLFSTPLLRSIFQSWIREWWQTGEKWEESFQGFFLYRLGGLRSVNLWGSCVASVWGRDSEMPWRRKTHHSLAVFVVESWSFYGAVISINFIDRWISNKKPLLLRADCIWGRQEQFLSILLC